MASTRASMPNSENPEAWLEYCIGSEIENLVDSKSLNYNETNLDVTRKDSVAANSAVTSSDFSDFSKTGSTSTDDLDLSEATCSCNTNDVSVISSARVDTMRTMGTLPMLTQLCAMDTV